MIFFDQFKVHTIKFGKCFAEFMIPISLLKKFLNLNSLLVKRQIDNPSPGAVTGGN